MKRLDCASRSNTEVMKKPNSIRLVPTFTTFEENTMLKKMLLVSAISAAFAATPSIAQQQGGQQGGQQNNQVWLQEQTTGAGTQIYVSTAGVRQVQQALNQQGFDVGNVNGIWSNQTVRGVQDYQRSKGLEPTGTLTLALANSLGQQNILTSAPQTSGGQGQQWRQERAQGQGTPLMISPAGVRQIQQELNKRGYDVGRVDGQWGDSTARAAMHFQKANGLEPNGKPDVNLIAALGGTQAIFQSSGQSSGGNNNMQWAQETATGPGVPVWASPATVRQIQQGLNQAGYDVGRVDGQWGQQTVRAVQDFQRTRGLEPTGTLTTSLLASIGQGNWMQGQIGGGQSSGGQGGGQQQQSSGQGGGSQQQGGFGQSSGGQGGQQQGSSQSVGGQGGQQQQGFGQSSGGQGQGMSGQQSGGMQSSQGGQQQQGGFGQSSGGGQSGQGGQQ
jgi:peptidoglycan hydrolase-like protein with peptidoglycan-binding domain